MGFLGLAQQRGMLFPGGQYGGGFDTSRTLKGGITGTEIIPPLQGQTPRTEPVYPSGQSPNAGKDYQPYGNEPPNYPNPRGPQGPMGPQGPEGKPGQSTSGGLDWMYAAPATPAGNLANIGIPLEDQIAIQQVGQKIKQFGGGYAYSPTKPSVVYSSQNGPYDNSGVPLTTGYPGLGMSGVVAKSTGITGGPGYAPPARTAPGEYRAPGQPTWEERMAAAGQNVYQDYAQAITQPTTPTDIAAAPPVDLLAAAKSLQVKTALTAPKTAPTGLLEAFKSISGAYFGNPSTAAKKVKGGSRETLLGGGTAGTFLNPSQAGGGFFGVGGVQTKRGRTSLLG